MNIKTKFNVGDVVGLELGSLRLASSRYVVKAVHVDMDELCQHTTYTVDYNGYAITVPESMIYSTKPIIIYENLEEEN